MSEKGVEEIINDKCRRVLPEDIERNLSLDDTVCTMYGLDTLELTKKDIKSLQNGKCIWFTDGEYAHLLYMKREGDRNE